MVYLSGVTDHHVRDEDMVDHIVRLVEAKAAEIERHSIPIAGLPEGAGAIAAE
jgi:(E)-4-hydroxy-3-methylbut-2-enyl-diphosphate synthase